MSLDFESNVTALLHNQPFQVRGQINNIRGGLDLEGFKIVLRERVKKVSASEFSDMRNQEFILCESLRNIPIGRSLPFTIDLSVP